jgi:large subunit ribosomal protein L7/L12
MAKLTTSDLIGAFRDMTLLELSGFVKDFEAQFGVTAAVTAPPAGNAGDLPDEPDEPDEFDVILLSAGATKIPVIKEIRTLTRLGLKDSKDLADSLPKCVLTRVSADTAQKATVALQGAGASAVIRPAT